MVCDILQDIPTEEWQSLLMMCENKLGNNRTHVTNFLHNAIDWMHRFPDDPYVILMSTNGNWREHATFVGFVTMPYLNGIFMSSLQDSNEELLEGLLNTSRFDWNLDLTFSVINDSNLPVVYEIVKKYNLTVDDQYIGNVLRLDKEVALKFDESCPDHVYVAPVPISYAPLINEMWPHKFPGSDVYTAATLARNFALGVFVKHYTDREDELVSWAYFNYMGAIGVLNTVDGHTSRGYAKLVVRAMAKELARRGWDSQATAKCGNAVSRKVFLGLGFEIQPRKISFVITSSKGK